ncbi:DUF3019 domain-containing protein [Permianibacter sp. IMCC34836]|uniref:DUF3019 domain-containing protein n=1 Tax=Permianibacter fluminis TaxID=2738515 RepID=UPI001551B14A|nr:DUF3019 domain-containing protein [Permianibacter fluminis]NQD35697.1 DUF3019 domain-containing protein [Permianibacter fluminis]
MTFNRHLREFSLRRLRAVAAALPSLLGLLIAAVPVVASAEQEAPLLQLNPRSCLQTEADTPCVERLRIRWSAATADGVCIWQRDGEQPLFCESRNEGERELLLPILLTTRFELKARNGGPVLASVELLVMTPPADGKRRRYQHPWSIF